MELRLNQAEISSLARMSFIAERESGKRFKLSQPESITELLKHVAHSTNQELSNLFHEFVARLDISAQEQLVYRGVPVPEHLRQQAAAESVQVAETVKQSKRVYRGRVIDEPAVESATSVPGKDNTVLTSSNATQTVSRPKRVYRGRVIED